MELLVLAFVWNILLSPTLCGVFAIEDHISDEFKLKEDVRHLHRRDVRPVKFFKNIVRVKFDIALRQVLDMDMKRQVLTTSVWIRIYWQDENVNWDPLKYSGIDQVNFRRGELWTPDVVLYNSADSNGSGLLNVAMDTDVIMDSQGNCSWYCPLILKSECTVDVSLFPFDKQMCPLKFGLWSHDGSKVDIDGARKMADLANLRPSGEWIIHGSPLKREVSYYACCPDKPYPHVTFTIILQRKSRFYLFNLIWPGSIIGLMSCLTFILPPEAGERVSLGITNLLSMLVFLLLVYESIPPTSEAIPLAGKFFLSLLIICSGALLFTCFIIKFAFYRGCDLLEVPYFVRVWINQYLAALLLVNREAELQRMCNTRPSMAVPNRANHMTKVDLEKTVSNNACNVSDPQRVPMEKNGILPRYAGRNRKTLGCGLDQPLLQPTTYPSSVVAGMDMIVDTLNKQRQEGEYKAEWRLAVKVLDRLFFMVVASTLVGTFMMLFFSPPKFLIY